MRANKSPEHVANLKAQPSKPDVALTQQSESWKPLEESTHIQSEIERFPFFDPGKSCASACWRMHQNRLDCHDCHDCYDCHDCHDCPFLRKVKRHTVSPGINKPRLINLGGPTKRVRICIVFYTARFMTRGRCLKFRRWLGCNHSEISREMRRWVGSGFRSKIQLQLYYILVTVHIYNAHTHAHTHTHTRTRTRNTYTYT